MLVFTIDDLLQIAFFQVIYIILLVYLTRREYLIMPKRAFFWIMLSTDFVYAILITATIYRILNYIPHSNTDGYGWFLYLLAALGSGILILFAFVTYKTGGEIIGYIRAGMNKTRTVKE